MGKAAVSAISLTGFYRFLELGLFFLTYICYNKYRVYSDERKPQSVSAESDVRNPIDASLFSEKKKSKGSSGSKLFYTKGDP